MATSSHGVKDNIMKLLATSTGKELETLPPLSGECCIYRVPESLRQSNERHYTPQVVSIGPIHYGKPELRAMEEHKKRYLQDFLKLSQANLEECFLHIQNSETRLRNCYAHHVELNSQNFIKMVLVDAAFLIMLFLRHKFSFRNLSGSIDRVHGKSRMINEIRYDVILLENQLPFFILEELYMLSNIKSLYNLNEEAAMVVLAYESLKENCIIKIPQRDPPAEAEHLLALLRNCLKPADWVPKRKASENFTIPGVKELHQAGVKLKVGSKNNIFDIKYEDGVLEIPFLSIHDYTELVFRNLQAFEICHNLDRLFIDYFIMMQQFTVASTDAELLIGSKVIDNGLPSSQALSKMFHDLSPGNLYHTNSFGYADVIKELNDYYAIPWNKWKATWIQKYFKAPWAIFSFCAAVFLLILGIIQAVCSVLQVT